MNRQSGRNGHDGSTELMYELPNNYYRTEPPDLSESEPSFAPEGPISDHDNLAHSY